MSSKIAKSRYPYQINFAYLILPVWYIISLQFHVFNSLFSQIPFYSSFDSLGLPLQKHELVVTLSARPLRDMS